MRTLLLFIGACLLASAAPLTKPFTPARTAPTAFPGWPDELEGRPLRRLPLEETEKRFSKGFPGRIGRFSNGDREVVLRWVQRPTRLLHRPSVCFLGAGYKVSHLPPCLDDKGRQWTAFRAVRRDRQLVVRSRVYSDRGESWPDVSAWFWAAALNRSKGPWWSVTIAGCNNSFEDQPLTHLNSRDTETQMRQEECPETAFTDIQTPK